MLIFIYLLETFSLKNLYCFVYGFISSSAYKKDLQIREVIDRKLELK